MAHHASRLAPVALLATLIIPAGMAAEPLAVGPLNLGMSLDEIRAAAPEAGWRNERVSPFSSRVFALASTTPLEIAGLRFGAYAEVDYYSRRIDLDADLAARDAPECERAVLAWLAGIESQAGPFTGNAPRVTPGRPGGLEWHSQVSASGSITLSPAPGIGTPDRREGERVSFGKSSTALVEAYDELYRPRARRNWLGGPPDHLTLSTARRERDQQVEVTADFGAWASDDDADRDDARQPERAGCRLQVSLQRQVAPPPPAAFDAARHAEREPANLAERHLSYPRNAPGFAEPIDVELSCSVSRQTGFAYACELKSPVGLPVPLEETALNRSRLLQYDMTGIDRDDPQALRGPVRIRLDPGERQPLDFLDAPRTPLDQVAWDRTPAAGQIEEVPMPFAETGIAAANPVSVELTCRVLGDGSLICVGARQQPSFWTNTAVRRVATRYRSAATLRDGSPSAGRVIDLTVQFRPAF